MPTPPASCMIVPLLTVLALALGACGVDLVSDGSLVMTADPDVVGVDPDPIDLAVTTTTLDLLPPGERDINGDNGSEINQVIANAVVDIEEFWTDQYPALYGSPYQPLSGELWAIDSDADPEGIPCVVDSIDEVLYNAYYCPPDDAVAWDQEFLIPEMEKQFGEFTVAVVMAHEWGHVIQERAGVDEPTIVAELQADCFAGAWVRHVRFDR
ncbi:MAG: neutral zinc metallopeptidase, partial [Aquihabitans sp.]